MPSSGSGQIASDGFLQPLRVAALVAVALGAVGSVVLMLRAGRDSPQRALMVLMAIWVLAPFIALALLDLVSKRWSVLTRATLYGLMLCLTVGSLAFYGYVVLRPPKSKLAFMFVAVPLGSWALMTVVVPIAALVSRVRSRRSAGG